MYIWPVDCIVSITVVKTLMLTKHLLSVFSALFRVIMVKEVILIWQSHIQYKL
jgi:hypothetical protein